MSEHVNPSRRPAASADEVTESMRHQIAPNLAIEADRLRYHNPGQPSRIGVTGKRWQIHYRGEWQDLSWHFDGPLA